LVEKEPPERFVLLTMVGFTDRAFAVDVPNLRLLALGDWQQHMVPPSILEAFVALTLRQAAALVAPSLRETMHFGTRGCLFDYAADLSESRYKVMQGFISTFSRDALARDQHADLADGLQRVLNTRRWLGGPEKSGDAGRDCIESGEIFF
jgi:hypothetical protein